MRAILIAPPVRRFNQLRAGPLSLYSQADMEDDRRAGTLKEPKFYKVRQRLVNATTKEAMIPHLRIRGFSVKIYK